jgi:hypothetical protein
MKISARSVLMSGITTVAASAVVIAPSVQPAPPPRPEVQLVASTQVLQQQQALLRQFNSLGDVTPLLASIVVPPGLGTPPPSPPGIPALPATNSLASFIDNAYLTIEPWVSYGFEVGAWAFSWVPGIGWLAPQIWPIGYNLGEALIGSAVFNFTDWLRGDGGIIDNVIDWGGDAINALIQFGIDQWNFWIGFPLPPLPGIASTAPLTAVAGPGVGVTNAASDLVNAIYTPVSNTITYGVGVLNAALAPIPLVNIVGAQADILWNVLADPIADSFVYHLVDPVLNQPLNINSYINGVVSVGTTTVNSLINTGIAEANYFLGIPLAAQASTQKSAEVNASEVGAVPSTIKASLNGPPAAAGPLTEVTKTLRNVRKEIRANLDAVTERDSNEGAEAAGNNAGADAAGNEVVRAPGAVRGAAKKVVADVVNAVGAGKTTKTAEDATKAPTTVAKSIGDTARKVIKNVRQAANEARDTAKNRAAGDEQR